MKVEIINNHVCGIPLEEFPQRYVGYHNSVREGGTIPLERNGAEFQKKCLEGDPLNFVFQGEVKDFIKEVLWWGIEERLYDEVLGRIYSANQPEEIVARRVHSAAETLQNGKLEGAVQILDALQGIGLSIASKMLRMMSPEKAVAFDEQHLQRKLPYSADSDGYANFCGDCVAVAKQMNEESIEHEPSIAKMRGSNKWLAADVEAVIFDHLRG